MSEERQTIIRHAPAGAALADPETVSRTYRAFLNLLILEPHHATALIAEGFTERQLKNRVMYRSLPRDEDDKRMICRELLRNGYPLLGVPGFHLTAACDDTGEACPTFVGDGILAPVINADGQVTALCDPVTGRWFTSAGLHGGCAPDVAGAYHLALGQPGVLHGMFPGRGLQTILLITKGVMNADIAAARLQINSIGLLDLSDMSAAVDFLVGSPPVLTAIALDHGQAENAKVPSTTAISAIGRALVEMGMPVVRMSWRPESGATFRSLLSGRPAGLSPTDAIAENPDSCTARLCNPARSAECP